MAESTSDTLGIVPTAAENVLTRNTVTQEEVPELRRSSRSTRGKHSRYTLEDQEPAATSKPSSGVKKDKVIESEVVAVADDGVVKCVCNISYENDEQMMAQCEKCDNWQHVKCLFGKEDESCLPENYYCHQCEPGLYPNLKLDDATGGHGQLSTDPADSQDDILSSSNNNVTEHKSPVDVDGDYTPPSKKRKVATVSLYSQYQILNYNFFIISQLTNNSPLTNQLLTTNLPTNLPTFQIMSEKVWRLLFSIYLKTALCPKLYRIET